MWIVVVYEKVETVFQFGFTFSCDRFVVASIIALWGLKEGLSCSTVLEREV